MESTFCKTSVGSLIPPTRDAICRPPFLVLYSAFLETALDALEGKPLPVYGDGQNVRDWLYVEDHCQALRTVLERGTLGQVYNIGGNCERTNLQIVLWSIAVGSIG